MIRRFGEAPLRGKTYVLRPGAYGILARGNKLLVTLQSKPYVEFQLPGGGIDLGENGIAALHREVREETGWKISSPKFIGSFRRFVFMPEYEIWAEKLCHVFAAQPVYRLSAPTEPFHTAHWMTIREASSLLGNEGDRYFVSRLDH
ncbi:MULTISPECIES: NUDIX hydrolase [Falsihalocynthiibacter]|uniref:NUDIX hydrolase n=1 Tax=Falsihalocynthiibacter arcticus TaxID=1579316 RepID=A0A126V5D7_9RHOB|nr:NUDIX hydrolase [Falsihalocynthiibacter arcticus]AML53551.1 NUDIX hydrolase [Falsihalocynthiibacter arcticus]